jgi:hypothetical protein
VSIYIVNYAISSSLAMCRLVSISPSTFSFGFYSRVVFIDRLSGLVVRVPGYRSRGFEFDSRLCQIFWEVFGVKRGPLDLVRIIQGLIEKEGSVYGLEKRD